MKKIFRYLGILLFLCYSPVAFAQNPAVVPYMLDNYFSDNISTSRSLTFRGWEVARIQFLERVEKIQVWRDGKNVFEQLLKGYPNPYEDAFSEQALEGFDLHPGDKIVFHIARPRTQTKDPSRYEIPFTMP